MATTAVSDDDVIVVGAGISGIAAARFYLDIHPNCRLAILEQDNCLGGVWNAREQHPSILPTQLFDTYLTRAGRGYEGFWTQWTTETAEFSDTPMPSLPEEDVYFDFFKAKHTTRYLDSYADKHTYAGQTLRDRIKFNFAVRNISKVDDTWLVAGQEVLTKEDRSYQAPKLIVASGLTTLPVMPDLPGKELFTGQILHQGEFGSSDVISSSEVQHVTVIGGGKSSADMIYDAVMAGKVVTWLIRTCGAGPGFFLSPEGRGPYKNAFALGSTRVVSTMTPSYYNTDNAWARFLHGSNIGKKVMETVWGAADKATINDAKFDTRECKGGFEKLKPRTPIFWQNGTGGLLNHADFWAVIAKNVQIYEGEVTLLEKNTVHITGGISFPADAILCGTGWAPSLQFFSPDLLAKLDVPHALDTTSDEDREWAQLEAKADKAVLDRFPRLANPPPYPRNPYNATPYRLYHGIAPLADDSIVFIGHVLVGNYFLATEAQAIWVTAYLDKRLALPSLEARKEEIANFVAWDRRRYLSNGEKGNWMTFELTGYMDRLLREVGLKSHLKGWFTDMFSPCRSRNFSGLKDEYVKLYGKDKDVGEVKKT